MEYKEVRNPDLQKERVIFYGKDFISIKSAYTKKIVLIKYTNPQEVVWLARDELEKRIQDCK